jgi:amidase
VNATALGLAAQLRSARGGAVALAEELLGEIERLSLVIGAVAATDRDRTLAAAGASDMRLSSGEARPFEGVPFTVKNWIDAEGWPITGEQPTIERRATHDAPAVQRLRDVGAVVLAITRVPTDAATLGPTSNPHDPARAPGGSSSGAAALVAAGASPLALGSDSGGSVRLPAAWCGVAGLKPTFGRVPLTGHYPRCGALEDARTVIGPLARSVDDLAAALAVIAGPDGFDAGVVPMALGEPSGVDVRDLRVAFMGEGCTSVALDALARAGATVLREPLADVREDALEITRRYWRRHQLSGEENMRLLWDWDRFRRRMLVATAAVDIVVTPATEGPAPLWRDAIDTDYEWCLPWSLTGSPAVVVPVAMTGGLPLAVQVVAAPWQDHIALAAARCIESAVGEFPIAQPLGR